MVFSLYTPCSYSLYFNYHKTGNQGLSSTTLYKNKYLTRTLYYNTFSCYNHQPSMILSRTIHLPCTPPMSPHGPYTPKHSYKHGNNSNTRRTRSSRCLLFSADSGRTPLHGHGTLDILYRISVALGQNQYHSQYLRFHQCLKPIHDDKPLESQLLPHKYRFCTRREACCALYPPWGIACDYCPVLLVS